MDKSTDIYIPAIIGMGVILVFSALVVTFVIFAWRRHKKALLEIQERRHMDEEKRAKQTEQELRDHQKEDAPIIKWLEGYKAIPNGEIQRLSEYSDPPSEYRDYWYSEVNAAERRIALAKHGIKKATEERRLNDEAAARINSAKAQTDEAIQFVELQRMLDDRDITEYLTPEDYNWADGRMEELNDLVWDRLVEKARTGDRKSFKAVRKMRHDSESNKYPSDWNEIVARMIKNPEVDDFKGNLTKLHNRLESGDLRLMAIDALREKSLVKAKIILAIVNDDEGGWLKEVGEPMLTRLGEMVIDTWTQSKQTAAPTDNTVSAQKDVP